MEYAQAILNKILSELFPALCFKCKKRGAYICARCIENIPRVKEDEPGFISVFQYKDQTIRHILWSLKYKGSRDIARVCANMLYEKLYEEVSDMILFGEFSAGGGSASGGEKPLIVPVPLSKKRLRERGFNQAELIAREVALLGTFELNTEVLQKQKETRPQATIKNRAERLENVARCFGVSCPEKIVGRNVILIDDIYTTGGTMLEARKVLKEAEAQKILMCTIAH